MDNIIKIFKEVTMIKLLIPVGIFLIIFSIFAYKAVDRAKDFIEIEAEVSRVTLYEEAYTDTEGNLNEATYTVYVKYIVDETQYEEEYGIFPNYKEGDKVTIAYNPENPRDIVQPNTIVLPIVLFGVGIISLIVGTISVIKSIKNIKNA